MRLLPKNGLVSGDSGQHRRLRIFGDLRARAKSQPILNITTFAAHLEWLDLFPKFPSTRETFSWGNEKSRISPPCLDIIFANAFATVITQLLQYLGVTILSIWAAVPMHFLKRCSESTGNEHVIRI